MRDLPAPLTFGVFPLGVAGAPYGTASGAPDDYEAIGRALEDLRGGGPPLLPRMYVGWSGPQSTSAVCDQVEQLTRSGVAWDVVLVDDLSRLARDNHLMLSIIAELSFEAIRVISVADGLDPRQ